MKVFKVFLGISKKAAYWKKMKTSVFERTILLGFWFCWFAGEAGFRPSTRLSAEEKGFSCGLEAGRE